MIGTTTTTDFHINDVSVGCGYYVVPVLDGNELTASPLEYFRFKWTKEVEGALNMDSSATLSWNSTPVDSFNIYGDGTLIGSTSGNRFTINNPVIGDEDSAGAGYYVVPVSNGTELTDHASAPMSFSYKWYTFTVSGGFGVDPVVSINSINIQVNNDALVVVDSFSYYVQKKQGRMATSDRVLYARITKGNDIVFDESKVVPSDCGQPITVLEGSIPAPIAISLQEGDLQYVSVSMGVGQTSPTVTQGCGDDDPRYEWSATGRIYGIAVLSGNISDGLTITTSAPPES